MVVPKSGPMTTQVSQPASERKATTILGAYENPVLLEKKHSVDKKQHCARLQEWRSKEKVLAPSPLRKHMALPSRC